MPVCMSRDQVGSGNGSMCVPAILLMHGVVICTYICWRYIGMGAGGGVGL